MLFHLLMVLLLKAFQWLGLTRRSPRAAGLLRDFGNAARLPARRTRRGGETWGNVSSFFGRLGGFFFAFFAGGPKATTEIYTNALFWGRKQSAASRRIYMWINHVPSAANKEVNKCSSGLEFDWFWRGHSQENIIALQKQNTNRKPIPASTSSVPECHIIHNLEHINCNLLNMFSAYSILQYHPTIQDLCGPWPILLPPGCLGL